MDEIKPLRTIKDLKINELRDQFQRDGFSSSEFIYDEESDILILKIFQIKTETIVHYLDNSLGLLYDPKTLQVIGFHIEGFKHSFIKKHKDFASLWYIDDPCEIGGNIWDLAEACRIKGSLFNNHLFEYSQKKIYEHA